MEKVRVTKKWDDIKKVVSTEGKKKVIVFSILMFSILIIVFSILIKGKKKKSAEGEEDHEDGIGQSQSMPNLNHSLGP